MICYRCGAELPDNSKFCGKCGAEQQGSVPEAKQSISEETQTAVNEQIYQDDIRMNQQDVDPSVRQGIDNEPQKDVHKEPPMSPIPPTPAKGSKNPKKKTLIALLCAAIVLFLGAAVFLFSQYQTMKKNYEAGVKQFKARNYTQAEESFDKAGWYHSGEKMSRICSVFGNMENKQYTQAIKTAEDISDFSVKDKDLQTSLNAVLNNYYAQAEIQASTGIYDEAVSIYRCLGSYKDSKQAADYYDAVIYMDQDNLEKAIELYKEADTYKDAKELAGKCEDYMEAAELQDKGDDASLEKADEIFSSLGDFKDAEARGLACRSVKLYKEAKAKADKEDYKGAHKILSQYPSNPYPGWQDLKTECYNQIQYKDAEAQYKKEHYYKAYVIYKSLGDFKDSKKKMDKCIQDKPDKHILFQDGDYESSSVSLTIKNNRLVNEYVKMYNSKDKLIARIFIKSFDSATINLTSGTYHINSATGNNWFGKKDMFGDEGYYARNKVNGSYNFVLKDNYRYTLTSGAGATGDSVGGETINQNDF